MGKEAETLNNVIKTVNCESESATVQTSYGELENRTSATWRLNRVTEKMSSKIAMVNSATETLSRGRWYNGQVSPKME